MDASFILTTEELEHLKNGGICLIRADGDGFKMEKTEQIRLTQCLTYYVTQDHYKEVNYERDFNGNYQKG